MSGLDIEFERDVVARALRDAAFARQASGVLDDGDFSTPHLAWMWGCVKDVLAKHGELMTPAAFKAIAGRDYPDAQRRLPYLKEISSSYRRDASSAKVALEEMVRFRRFARLSDGMMNAAKKLEEGDVDEAEREVRQVLAKSVDKSGWTSLAWAEDFEARQAERLRLALNPEEARRIPTGITSLDKILRGGAGPGELCEVMATTNKGKSIFLVNVGYAAIMRGFRTVYFTLEMTASQQATRFDSRFTFHLYDRFHTADWTEEERTKMRARFERQKKFTKNLRIVGLPMNATPSMLRSALDEAKDVLGGVDLIEIDSLDHMLPDVIHRETRINHTEIYKFGKQLAQDEMCALWSSVHAGREWEKKVATTAAAGESYDKSRLADVQVSINDGGAGSRRRAVVSDGTEGDEDPTPALKGFVPKNRDGRARVEFAIEADLARMLMRDPEDPIDGRKLVDEKFVRQLDADDRRRPDDDDDSDSSPRSGGSQGVEARRPLRLVPDRSDPGGA